MTVPESNGNNNVGGAPSLRQTLPGETVVHSFARTNT